MQEIKIKKSIDIFLTTFKRLHLLKKTVKSIYDNTKYPYRLWIANNDKNDIDTINYLKRAKGWGYVHDFINVEENLGQANGYKVAYEYAEKQLKGKISKYIIHTQDDLLTPDLMPCWLERMIHLMDNNKDHGAIAMRIERTRRRDINEFVDLIPSDTACPAVFRITSKEMIETIGHSSRPHWESHTFSNKIKKTGKKLAMATKLYASHIGFMEENKGFKKDFTEYHTYSKERVTQGADQPYPDLEEKSKIPIKINTVRDSDEHKRRQEYYDYWGRDDREGNNRKRLVEEQKELTQYCEKGKGLDIGCGWMKCHENALGMDVFPHDTVDIVGDCTDLWMFKDNELDFIVNSHLLEHLPDTPAVLEEWKRVLKPGGVLAIAVPDGELKAKYVLYNGHKVNIGLNTLGYLLRRKLGMKIIRAEHVKKNSPNKIVALIVAKKR